MIFFSSNSAKPPQKPMVVKTIVPITAPPEKHPPRRQAQSVSVKPSPPPQSKEQPAPILKSSQTSTPARKASPAPVAPASKKNPPVSEKRLEKSEKQSVSAKKKQQEEQRGKMSQKLLQELEESLDKLGSQSEKRRSSKTTPNKRADIPTPIHSLHTEASDSLSPSKNDSSENYVYQEALISYLKQTLHLPEHGEVKIQLTLKQDGSVVNLLVLKTESEKNRKYLESSLPHLRCPYLQGTRKQETFIVTFCNEI